ncbi:MAG: HAD hydrolase family protein [Solobacterium sp.]|jgi:hydroxymethylpyrimidine pyrophosphatase-like HAD family hydrolase|nr:HAD hydrolase family protein [Stecheria intestinalis]MCI2155240.1 HAD hydrolase family protein [Solobacterium sp.]MDD5881540.1 HAD hydrolase family protein [Stecheria intestinalis]
MKLIFIDVDGTLLDYESNLPDSASQAIRETRKKEIWFTSAPEDQKQKSMIISGKSA